MRLHSPSSKMALGAAQFSMSLLQIIFMFYYVKVYMNIFHVPTWWFNLAQGMFMVWNAINDPLFGFVQDTHQGWLRSRTTVIRKFAPFLCGSFLILWFPWSTKGSWIEGVHLIIALFLYDAFFSIIGVSWSAFFADSTNDPASRAGAMKASQTAILISLIGISITEKASHSLQNFGAFQVVVCVMSFIALLLLLYAGLHKESLPMYAKLPSDSSASANSWKSGLVFVKQTLKERDFVVIVIVNFLHIMRSVAHMNFASISIDLLVSDGVLPKGSIRLSIFYGMCTMGPQILIICLEKAVVFVGAARMMQLSFVASVILSVVFYCLHDGEFCTIIFMFLDSVTVHSVSPLFNILFSEYIAEDSRRYSRPAPISSLIFSLNALFTKPAQSIAPVIIVAILNLYGYEEYASHNTITANLSSAMILVLYGTPLLLGVLQYIAFKHLSVLKTTHKTLSTICT